LGLGKGEAVPGGGSSQKSLISLDSLSQTIKREQTLTKIKAVPGQLPTQPGKSRGFPSLGAKHKGPAYWSVEKRSLVVEKE